MVAVMTNISYACHYLTLSLSYTKSIIMVTLILIITSIINIDMIILIVAMIVIFSIR